MYWSVDENVVTTGSQGPNYIFSRGNDSVFAHMVFSVTLWNITATVVTCTNLTCNNRKATKFRAFWGTRDHFPSNSETALEGSWQDNHRDWWWYYFIAYRLKTLDTMYKVKKWILHHQRQNSRGGSMEYILYPQTCKWISEVRKEY